MLVLTAILSFVDLRVRAEEGGWSPTVTLSSWVANQYVTPALGVALSRDPVVQSDLRVSFKNGIFLDLWGSRSLKGKWNGSLGDEIDYGIGWSGSIATNLNFKVGFSYFDEPQVFTLGAGDILYTYAFLTKDLKYLSVTAGFENYNMMPGSGLSGGNLMSVGFSKYQLFCNGKLGLQASVAGVYDTGTIITSHGFFLKGRVGADWNMTKRLTFNVIGVTWHVPLTPHDIRRNELVYSSGVSYRF